MRKKYIDENGKLHRRKPKTGILLLNIGSSKSEFHTRNYLTKMFTDKDIIQLPCQSILGRFIAFMITKRSIRKHQLIGGFDYVNYWTNIQAEMLGEYLDYHSPDTAPHIVLHCQRYSEPTADEAIQRLLKSGVKFCVAFPLYPQYSMTTTLSSLKNLDKAIDLYDSQGKIKWSVIQSFNSHSAYLKLIADCILSTLNEFPKEERDKVNVIFSAHSLPLKVIEKGDLYKSEIKKNLRKVKEILNIPNPIYLSWQSQEGKNWLEPKTIDVIKSISYIEGYGNANIIVFPLSFVSDNVEILYDIDVLQADIAKKSGIKCFKRCESFNDNPQFIEALGSIFLDHLKLLHSDTNIENEDDLDDLDKYLNFALIDNNIKRYIDSSTDLKHRHFQNYDERRKKNLSFNNGNIIFFIVIISLFSIICLLRYFKNYDSFFM
ncbi:ferrochelatase-domain-containing protein [Piromyces finnis]|uniref:Ferrochelatase n=1 Tax=Piromyces finnis TaxID=1754191 RepID=A0A1Y1V1N4_9FUNG|nr:ferrochelatase-domain-containing protein [Piromyces finnis]|eukprot:ORX44555.1 ferrochelatase-domain-containing protein [Piromyces finnis]